MNSTVLTERAAAGDLAAPDSREAQRAATLDVLRYMATLDRADPEYLRLRAEVVEDHMPYARRIARRFSRGGVANEDFDQVAFLGLVKAVDNFDPEYGAGFVGYAAPVIIGEIKRHFRDTTWAVHVPRRMQELSGALHKATEALAARLGREPTVVELAEHLDASTEEVLQALEAAEAYTTASLDQPVGEAADGASLGDQLGDEDPAYDLLIDREVLRRLVAGLEERDKRILLMRYFRGMTQAEIGAELGVSQMQISRLLNRILARLRAGFEEV